MTKSLFLSASVLTLALGCAHAQPAAAPVSAPAASASATRPADAQGGFSALVTADQDATLSAQMAGRIKRVHYSIGQNFNPGAVLVEFDCEESQAKLDSFNAEYLGARETHLAKLRLQGLGAAGDLEVTLTAAAGEKAKSQVRQQEAQMAYCSIKAPYAGRIVRLKAKQAESVAVNQPIIEIVAVSQLKATLNVPSSMALNIKPGTLLAIDIKETGRKYSAKVTRLNGRLDAASQSLEVEALFVGKTAGLLPGMIGQATLP